MAEGSDHMNDIDRLKVLKEEREKREKSYLEYKQKKEEFLEDYFGLIEAGASRDQLAEALKNYPPNPMLSKDWKIEI